MSLSLSQRKRFIQRFQQIAGLRQHIGAPDYGNLVHRSVRTDRNCGAEHTGSVHSNDSCKRYQSNLSSHTIISTSAAIPTEVKLSKGWYMLEARGSMQTIGANLCLIGDSQDNRHIPDDTNESQDTLLVGEPFRENAAIADSNANLKKSKHEPENHTRCWHILLGSHQSAKRVIYCSTNLDSLSICIDGKIESDDLPDLVLTRLSKSFAFSRIKRKIQYTSQYSHQISLDRHRLDATPWKARLSKAKSYYSFYNKLIERHLAPLPYYDWIANTERHESVVRKGKGSAGRPAIRGSSSMRPYSLGIYICLLYTSPSPRDQRGSRMPSSA